MRKGIILSASFLLFGLYACKDEGDLNPSFIEDTASSTFINDIRLTTQVKTVDSILTDEISTGLVGTYKDSVFGESRASFYVQPVLSSNFQVYYEANETFVTDSVILSFPYSQVFGDSGQTQVEVYRLDEELEKSKVYYSNDSAATIPALLGNKIFSPNPSKTLRIARPNLAGFYDTLTLAAQLRIPLDNALGDEIISKSGQSEVENSANFIKFFKGLKVQSPANLQPALNKQSILSLALTSSQSKMSVFYTVINANGDSSRRVVDYPVNTNSVRFNAYSHAFQSSAVANQINDGVNDSDFVYTLGMSGLQTEVLFPNLKKRFEGQSIVVNRAELVLPLASGSYTKSGFADNLILASKNQAGQLEFLQDFFEGDSYFGGFYDKNKNAYVFGINRYIQDILNGSSTSKALVILVEGSATSPERSVLFGPAQSSEKIKLNLYYSNTLQ